jgi:hypothetical protein
MGFRFWDWDGSIVIEKEGSGGVESREAESGEVGIRER